MDISKAFCHVKTLESTIAMIRGNIDSYHVQWYQGVSPAAKCNVLPEHKRNVGILMNLMTYLWTFHVLDEF